MERVTVRFNKRQLDAIEGATEKDLAENDSEAVRMLIDQGAADLGIVNGKGLQSSAERNRLKRVLQDAAEMISYVGLAWGLVLTLYPHSEVQWVVVAPIMLALTVIVAKNMFVRHA